MCAVLRFIQLIMTNIMKPITAIQIFYEPQVGTEQEVLRTFFSFVGCLVKTTRMSAEDMSKQHMEYILQHAAHIKYVIFKSNCKVSILKTAAIPKILDELDCAETIIYPIQGVVMRYGFHIGPDSELPNDFQP